MRVSFECDGGLADFRIEGMIETADLGPEAAERAERLLRPDKLREKRGTRHPHTRDLRVYFVGFREGQGYSEFRVEEGTATTEVLDLMEELVVEVVRRRRLARDRQDAPQEGAGA